MLKATAVKDIKHHYFFQLYQAALLEVNDHDLGLATCKVCKNELADRGVQKGNGQRSTLWGWVQSAFDQL